MRKVYAKAFLSFNAALVEQLTYVLFSMFQPMALE